MKVLAAAFIMALLFSAVAVAVLFGTSQASSSITLSVSTGKPGNSVTVSGTGFQPNSIVGIGFGPEVEVLGAFDLVDGADYGPWYGYFNVTPIKPTTFQSYYSYGPPLIDPAGNTTLYSSSSYFVNGSVWYVNATMCRTSKSNLTLMIPYEHDLNCISYEFSLTDAGGVPTDASGGFSTDIIVPQIWNGQHAVTVIGNWGNITSATFTVTDSPVPSPTPVPTPRPTSTPVPTPEQGATSGWTYGGSGYDYGYCVVETGDGGYAITGETRSYGAGYMDVWLIKTDAAGNMLWSKTYGGSDDDFGFCVVETGDGGYAIAGITGLNGPALPYPDAWLIGTGAPDNTDITGLYNASGGDVWLVKTDASGNLLWNQTYGGLSGDFGYCVVETGDGGYVITGITMSYGAGNGDVWLVKTDASGNLLWNQTYGGSSGDVGLSVVETGDGGYAITGATNSYDAGGCDVWLIKTDASGNMLWNHTYGETSEDFGYCVVETGDGGYVIAGYTESYGAGGFDVWLVKTDASGNLLWSKAYGGTGADYGRSVVETSDGNYTITGATGSYGAGNYDFYLVKTAHASPSTPSPTPEPTLEATPTSVSTATPTPAATAKPSTTATPTPQEPEQTDQTATIMGAAIIGTVIAAGSGLLIYFKKRK